MTQSLNHILKGYKAFREKYVDGDTSIMQYLSQYGQKPEMMVVACCDSRVDPALILQCDPGDLFIVRNVANIVPPYEKDEMHHGTSAALEFGINFLKVNHLVLLGHSQCGGVNALMHGTGSNQDDFISNWVSLIKTDCIHDHDHVDDYANLALKHSYKNCLTFPWIKEKIASEELFVHLWFFDIKTGQIFAYDKQSDAYEPLEVEN